MKNRTVAHTTLLVLVAGAALGMLSHPALSQNARNPDYSPDKALKSNARVNPSTLAMELSIPLGGYSGRGGAGLPITLSYSSKVWEMKTLQVWPRLPNNTTITDIQPLFAKRSAAGWSSSLSTPRIDYQYQIETYEGNYQGVAYEGVVFKDHHWNTPPDGRLYYIRRLRVQMPDGSSHELRANDTPIDCGNINNGCGNADFTGTFLSVDGSGLRLESGTAASVLYLPDGSRYEFGQNTGANAGNPAHTFFDRHGNMMTYNSGSKTWTDTIGRTVTDPIATNWNGVQNQTLGQDQPASFPGFGGGSYTVLHSWQSLENALDTQAQLNSLTNLGCYGDTEYSISPPYLFPNTVTNIRNCGSLNQNVVVPFNPIVLTKLQFPNGQYYEFKYNVYGEIVRIKYPSGGYERFQYGVMPPLQVGSPAYDVVNRGVTDRWLSANGDGNEVHWSYNATRGTAPNYTAYKVTVTNPDGTYSEQYIEDEPDENASRPYGFTEAKTGRSYEDRIYAQGGALLRRSLTEYTQTGPLSGGWSGATRDMRPSKQISMIFESGDPNALVTMTETVYDIYGHSDPAYFSALNAKQIKTYHYIVKTAAEAANANIATAAGWFAGQSAAKTVENTYIYDPVYQARNINGLVSESLIKDSNGTTVAKTQTTYDSVGFLTGATSTRWQDPGQYRGLPTLTKNWRNIAANQYVQTSAQYDLMGNLRYSWDGRNNLTETEYSSAYDYAYPTKVKSPVPDDTGAQGANTSLETTTTYDPNTGLPTLVTDPNNAVTSTSYDLMLRPTSVTAPNGHQTTTAYGAGTDASSRWVKVRTQIDGTNWKESFAWYDGLGRTVKTQSVDPATGDVFVDTTYDNIGRISSVTNPYRSGDAIYTTTTGYDALGRVQSVSLPGGALTTTAYGLATSGPEIGMVETTTDEAGRLRRTIDDVFDNLIRVDEPDLNGSLGPISNPVQSTKYGYDTNENLTQILQGGQTRSFSYDSINRLTQAVNPESGSFQFTYDANGNLLTKTDARGISTTFTYDRINRVTLKNYSDSTPDVTYYYDTSSVSNSKGRLTRVSSSVSETLFTDFRSDGKVLGSQQNIDGSTYAFSYSYNLAGDLTSQTYPSGKTITNTYDNNGDLAEVSRPLGLATYRYASAFKYTAAGEVEKVKFGNGRWEKTEFNPRRQITQIALGFTENDTGVWKANYDYGTWQGGYLNANLNNGSLARQTIMVPTVDQVPGFTAVQTYEYDTLDRLRSATETIGAQTWKQTFLYDRFGNKNYDTANTTTLGSCPPAVCNPTINLTNNRVQTNGYDSSGNVTSDAEGRTFTYDAENRQTAATGSNLSMAYSYDGNGERVRAYNAITDQTTYFIYDGNGELAAEYTVNVPPPTLPWISYLTNDALGSPRVITNSYGDLKTRRDFYPFGEEIGAGVGSRNTNQRYSAMADDTRVKFATYQRDIETGLDFAQSRYYQPKNGRFTSPDEFKGGPDEMFDFEEDASSNPTFYADLTNPQSLNKYQYGYNNPYRFNDPTGHCPLCVVAVVAFVAIVTGPDTVNAPGPGDPVYRNERGGNVFLNLLPVPGLRLVPKSVTRTVVKAATEPAKRIVKRVTTPVKSVAPKVPKNQRVGPVPKSVRKQKMDANKKANGGKLKCEYCGTDMEPGKKSQKGVSRSKNEATLDHIVPRSRGGDNSPKNLKPACLDCNIKKSDHD